MIFCGNINCKYNDYKGRCACKNVKLSYGYIHTVNDGVIDYYKCKSFEEQMNTKAPEYFHAARGNAKTGFTILEAMADEEGEEDGKSSEVQRNN